MKPHDSGNKDMPMPGGMNAFLSGNKSLFGTGSYNSAMPCE